METALVMFSSIFLAAWVVLSLCRIFSKSNHASFREKDYFAMLSKWSMFSWGGNAFYYDFQVAAAGEKRWVVAYTGRSEWRLRKAIWNPTIYQTMLLHRHAGQIHDRLYRGEAAADVQESQAMDYMRAVISGFPEYDLLHYQWRLAIVHRRKVGLRHQQMLRFSLG
jgi:hypothetical protein